MRYTIAALLSIILMLTAVPSYSHRGGNVDIRIASDRGSTFLTIPFKDYKKGRTHVIKKYLEAKKGENYGIVIRNRTNERIGVVIAVDGRNIITGKKSFLKNNEQMYIVDPFGSAKLEGWRTGQDTVHRFYFTDKSDSYAEKTFSDSSAMGVIAVAVFHEKKRPRILHNRQTGKEKEQKTPAAPSGRGELKSFESDTAGTGFGDGKYSPVVKVQFEPENIPFKKMLVKYEWHEVLCKKGVLKCWQKESNRLWDEDEYAPYPPGYKDR